MESNDHLEVRHATKTSFRTSVVEGGGRKSTKSPHLGQGLSCKSHLKDVVFICIQENCLKRMLCMKCVSDETEHLTAH